MGDEKSLCMWCGMPVADDEHASERLDLHLACEAEYWQARRDEDIERRVDEAIARKHGVTL